MSSSNKLSLPSVEKQEVVFDQFVKIRRDILRYANGKSYPYYTLEPRASAVVILGMTPEGYLVLNSEYRHPAGNVLLGAPGGYLETGEDPLVGGKREFLEETGYAGDKARILGSAYPFPGLSAQKIYYLYMEGVKKRQNPTLDPMEIMQTVLKHPAEVLDEIRNGQVVDGTLCTALFYFMNASG